MENWTNAIFLRGSLDGLPAYSHENHGRRFYRFFLEVERLSGTCDRLPVLASEELLNSLDLSGGTMVELTGQVRSFNNRAGTGRRLVITAYAETLAVCEGPCENQVTLTGAICKPPVFRRTPLGREICDIMLAVGRRYRRADYLPCILWGRAAREAADYEVGQQLRLTGRLQSRDYVKVLETGSETRTAYEISAIAAERTSVKTLSSPDGT
jgi:primosomal replication protein N